MKARWLMWSMPLINADPLFLPNKLAPLSCSIDILSVFPSYLSAGIPPFFFFFFSLIDSAEITENKHTNLCPWALEAKGLVIGCFKELVVHIIILSVSSLVVLRRLMEGKRGGKGWLTHGRDTYICSLRKIFLKKCQKYPTSFHSNGFWRSHYWSHFRPLPASTSSCKLHLGL